jgi:Tol biopolymer transport system component
MAAEFPIAFSGMRVESERFLLGVSADGGDLRRIYASAHVFAPAWSPGGRQLAFQHRLSPLRGGPGPPRLVIASAAGGGAANVLPLELGDDVALGLGVPRWSPDGGRLAFASVREGGIARVWLVSKSGGRPQLALPGFEPRHHSPTWSPSDSDAMVVVGQGVDGLPTLYRASLAEGHAEPLDLGAEFAELQWPRWDPGGRRLAFDGVLASDAGVADWNVFAFDVERSELIQVTDDPGVDRSPTWSPDGRAIVLSSSRRRAVGRGVELWRVSLDDLDAPTPLPASNGDDRWPDWYPGGNCSDD